MIRTRHFLYLLIVVAFTAGISSSQVQTGKPPFGSFSGGPDTVNLSNLNVIWNIPIVNKAGRGTNLSRDLTYDSSVWYPVGSSGNQSWQPVTNWGWQGLQPAGVSYVLYSVTYTSGRCGYQGQSSYQEWIYSNFSYFDNFGSWHSFPNISGNYYSSPGGTTCPPNGPQPPAPYEPVSQAAMDGSGYTLYVTMAQNPTAYVTDKNGNTFNILAGTTPPTSGATSAVDRNGNIISQSNGIYTDTLGTTALSVVGSSNTNFTYTAPSGANASYVVSYTGHIVRTAFGCNGITEYNSGITQIYLVDKITLPDSSFYQFQYEQTPGFSSDVTGRIASVTLPTGGQISYTYTGGSTGNITCADGSTSGLRRYTPDTGSNYWNYARTAETGAAYITTVTDPTAQANQTLIQFQGIYETQRDIYSGTAPAISTFPIPESTLQTPSLMKETQTCYNASSSPCTTTSVTLPITQRNVLRQLGSSGLQGLHVDTFSNGSGALTESDDYDYGPTAPGALLRKTLITYASLGSINVFPQTVTICNGTGTSSSCTGPSGNSIGTVVSQTNYNYDETAPATSSGVAQHTGVWGSRGNLTSINYPVSGLTSHFTYWDTGSVNTSQDINGATTTYNYSSNSASCQMAFPTGITEALGSMSQSYTWNCIGGVQLTSTDENSKTTTVTNNDAYFWRKNAVTDQLGNQTSFSYQPNPTYCCPTMVQSSLTFNNGNSVANDIQYKDGLGRTYVDQRSQSPGSSTLDSVSYTFDPNGRLYSVSMPCAIGNAGTCSTPKTTQTYDALNRPLQTTDGGGGYVSYSYSQNDVLVTIGPAPSGENTKRRQLEYNALGQLTSVCEITSATQSGSCGQTSAATGYLTKYTYDALGNLTGVTQNAQPGGTAQTRSYSYDGLGRLTSETNPESGTTTYAYDSATGTGCTPNSPGDLIKRVDANGNWTCYNYDALHRLTDIGNNSQSATNPCKRFRYDNSLGYPGSTKPVGLSNTLGRLIEAATDACSVTSDAIITDEWFSYSARGEVSDIFESTPHSGGYYHVAQSYWPHRRPYQLSGNIGLPTITYGADGEGRISTVSASSGQNPVSGTTYNSSSLPTQVTFGSADADIFAYDANTMRMTQYQFNINGQSDIGTLTWNANSTLQKLVVTDAFNSADNQTCNYGYDDIVRLASANCGAAAAQTFTYDPFGNINKSGSPYSFQPTYSSATNRMTSLPGNFTPIYDANGNVTNDSNHTYAWDADGNPITIDGVGLTFDALDRALEKNVSGSYTQIVYAPTGNKLALMNGQTLQKAFVPLPGQAAAVYTNTGLDHYRHSDWLGSSRLASTPARTVYSTTAYAPFGETYAQSGASDASFTGQNQDSVAGGYDFPVREYSMQGRWPSPDPGGLATAHLANPQSWNRYAYVLNNPLALVDPLGLDCVYHEDGSSQIIVVTGDCIDGQNGLNDGVFVDGTIDTNSLVTYDPSTGDLTFGLSNDNGGYGTGIAFGVFDPQISNGYQNSWMAALPQAGVLGQTGVNYALVVVGTEAAVAGAVVAAPAVVEAGQAVGAAAETYVPGGMNTLKQVPDFIRGWRAAGSTPGTIPQSTGGMAGAGARLLFEILRGGW